MEAKHAYVVQIEDHVVECYGPLEGDSNFNVVCDDEWDDDTWCVGHPVTGLPFDSWETVVASLQPYFNSDIIEITAV